MLLTLRESILWVGFKLTNKLHNFHYYYNILKSLQPCVSGWWGWKNGSEMRILAAKFNAKMRTDTSFLKLITTLPLLRVFKETWQGSRTLRYRGCIEKKRRFENMYICIWLKVWSTFLKKGTYLLLLHIQSNQVYLDWSAPFLTSSHLVRLFRLIAPAAWLLVLSAWKT